MIVGLLALLLATHTHLAAQSEPTEEPDFTPPPLSEIESANTRSLVKGLDIQGKGDGKARHFCYTLIANPGPLTLQLEAQAKAGSTSFSAYLEDEEGQPFNKLSAQASASKPVSQTASLQLEERQLVRLHVHIDPNCGAYCLTLLGALERP